MFEDEPHAEGAAAGAAAREALQALCQELNLDEGSAAEALDDFTAIRGNYSLEGEVIHWLACSLYVACRKSIIPTVGKGVMEGNCVSLTRILRSAKLRNFMTLREEPRPSVVLEAHLVDATADQQERHRHRELFLQQFIQEP